MLSLINRCLGLAIYQISDDNFMLKIMQEKLFYHPRLYVVKTVSHGTRVHEAAYTKMIQRTGHFWTVAWAEGELKPVHLANCAPLLLLRTHSEAKLETPFPC